MLKYNVSPFELGLYLGSSRKMTNAIDRNSSWLKSIGLEGREKIPKMYMDAASVSDRRALLLGFAFSAGTVSNETVTLRIPNIPSFSLADDIVALIASLGHKSISRESDDDYKVITFAIHTVL